ncbi:hypothetical protein D3C87_1548120 [compost metagenome]
MLAAESVPALTPVSVRAPAVPAKSTDVPSVVLPTVSALVVAFCCTRPAAPLVILVIAVLMSPMSDVLFAMLVVLTETC